MAFIGQGIILDKKEFREKFGKTSLQNIVDKIVTDACNYHGEKIKQYEKQLKRTKDKEERKKLKKKLSKRRTKELETMKQDLCIVKIKSKYFIGNITHINKPWIFSENTIKIQALEKLGYTENYECIVLTKKSEYDIVWSTPFEDESEEDKEN